jgi:hypothetical protein
MKQSPLIVFTVLLLALITLPSRAQRTNGKEDYTAVFSDVQQGISSANISLFSSHFHTQVHVTLRGGESGLYSANQAYYLLQNYFRDRHVTKFAFTTYGQSDTNPYATGGASFSTRNGREYNQVYVALAYNDDRWVITHINLY